MNRIGSGFILMALTRRSRQTPHWRFIAVFASTSSHERRSLAYCCFPASTKANRVGLTCRHSRLGNCPSLSRSVTPLWPLSHFRVQSVETGIPFGHIRVAILEPPPPVGRTRDFLSLLWCKRPGQWVLGRVDIPVIFRRCLVIENYVMQAQALFVALQQQV